jgi:antitoxin component YwqK of YwqJK toxin-antitoxin module
MKSLFAIIVLILNNFNINAQSIFNQLDTAGKKEGFWKGVYEESKRPRYEGSFSHGKEVGIFTFFNDSKTKTIIATREFNSKDNSAYTVFYDKNNNKVSEGKVVNKLYEGQWKYYHKASTSIMTLENYKNGKLEGFRTIFYPDGKTAEETNYKYNNKEGICKIYTQNGVLIEESNYKNNSYNGFAIFRDTQGNLVSKGNFVNGKKLEIWQFYEKGKLVKETNMSFPVRKSKTK